MRPRSGNWAKSHEMNGRKKAGRGRKRHGTGAAGKAEGMQRRPNKSKVVVGRWTGNQTRATRALRHTARRWAGRRALRHAGSRAGGGLRAGGHGGGVAGLGACGSAGRRARRPCRMARSPPRQHKWLSKSHWLCSNASLVMPG